MCGLNALEAEQRRQILGRCFDELTERQAFVMLLRFGGGMTLAQISDICGIRPASVAGLERRALKRMKAALAERDINSLQEI